MDDDDYKTVGRAVAISGDKVAITSSWLPEGQTTPGVFNGYVRIYHRNATTGTWGMTSQADGLVAGGNYGYRVKMEGNNLVVAAGTENDHRVYFIVLMRMIASVVRPLLCLLRGEFAA